MTKSEYIDSLEHLFNSLLVISKETTGRETTWFGETASIIFSKIGLTTLSLLRLVPESKFYATHGFQAWDISSTASLCRTIIDSYLMLFYIGIDAENQGEQELRKGYWEYHRHLESYRMIRENNPDSPRVEIEQQYYEKSKTSLQSLFEFKHLPLKRQKHLLKGKSPKVSSDEELCKRAGISKNYFKPTFKYLSNHTHTSPFSIEKMDLSAMNTDEAVGAFDLICTHALAFNALAIRDFLVMFPDQKKNISPRTIELIDRWPEIVRDYQSYTKNF